MDAPRVLVAIGPRLYAEGLASLLGKHRPRAEVTILGPPEGVEAAARRVRPHLVVAHRVPPGARGDFFWVEVAELDGGGWSKTPVAQISANGYSRGVAEVRTEHVLAALDRAEERFLGTGHAQEGGGGP